MKVQASVKKRSPEDKIVRRKGKVYVIRVLSNVKANRRA
jgi:ribosomal protein L36